MTTIIAGRFDEQSKLDQAVAALRQAGFPQDQISTFYVNPAGRHARFPIGGDHDKSPGAENSGLGTAAGTATDSIVGGIVGAATAPVTGPIGTATGALVGAHIGNLIGGLGAMKEDGEGPQENPVPVRQSGLLAAVSTPVASSQSRAISILRERGAHDIEMNEGKISQGDWEDFDPAAPPRLIEES